jgi:catechol 2,3-dioxygenase-like lactoylglutathione lyase family enzyme
LQDDKESAMPDTTMRRLFPVLPVRLMSESLRFYTQQLGFRVAFGEVSQAEPNYIGLRRDDVEIHLQFQFEEDFKKGTAGVAFIRIEVDDPDALYEEFRSRGVTALGKGISDTSWGTREFGFRDPNGNGLTFQRDL